MTWIILSILTALAVATQDAWVKKYFSGYNPWEMGTVIFVYCLPFLIFSLMFIRKPVLDATFFWCFAVSLPLNAAAFLLYVFAIRISPLSLTLPYLAFTPVFMLFTGKVFLGEVPGLYPFIGILFVVTGSYVLNMDPSNRSFKGPFLAFKEEPGARIMLFVSFLFSFAAVIGKQGMLHSSVTFFTVSFFTVMNITLPCILLITGKAKLKNYLQSPVKGLIGGLLLYLHIMLHAHAITMTKAVYMISLKRLSILFGILYGKFLFKEVRILTRLAGSGMMVAGAAVIMICAF
ncbi:MAG: DMT family transporter [Desulfobacteraceae bacterium]